MSGEAAAAALSEALAARKAAVVILDGVLSRKQPLDIVLDGLEGFTSLSSRDRAFTRMLATTTLRRLGQVDDIISKATERDEPPRPAFLHHILRIGVTQILFMDVPDYATVDTSVRLAEAANLSRQGGFVNAVLRRVGREGRDWLKDQNAPVLNTPDWLMQHWIKDYGPDRALEIASANLAEAPLDITVKTPAEKGYWEGTLQAVALPTGSLRRPSGGMVQDLPGFDGGHWWIQDAAAALPARLFGDVKDQAVFDLCAAPGGKTAQLAAMGAQVTALDRSAKRLVRLEANIARLKLQDRVTTLSADATAWLPPEPAQFILLDAPCTATGTIRRNPDALALKTPQDMAGLMVVQERLLKNAVEMLAPGGVLIYCTCSLQKDEGERQIAALLNTGAPVKRLPIAASEVGGLDSLITPDGDVRALPYHMAMHGGMDGFYIARLVRV
jgi:16S rRNA (cytosine967-C5)-methyltransferase